MVSRLCIVFVYKNDKSSQEYITIDINIAMHARLVPTAAFTCVHDAQSVIDLN